MVGATDRMNEGKKCIILDRGQARPFHGEYLNWLLTKRIFNDSCEYLDDEL